MRDEYPSTGTVTVLMLVGCALCLGGCYGMSKVHVSEGYRDSTIRKLSETGVLFKTWECETLGDGLAVSNNGGRATPETFNYTVSDPVVLAKLQTVPMGKRVRLHYRKQMSAWMPSGESKYFITGIEDVAETK